MCPRSRSRDLRNDKPSTNWPPGLCEILYTASVDSPARPIEFRGSSLENLSRFPATVRRKAGFQLFQVQQGDAPDDWKPMADVGPGVREIRIRERDGAFRVLYVASFAKAVYVLHCFQKKTQKTNTGDIDLARRATKNWCRRLENDEDQGL